MRVLIIVFVTVGLIAFAACGSPKKADDATPVPSAAETATVDAAVTTPPAFAAGPRRLAFVSDREGPFRLYTMNADGGDVRRLSDQPVAQMPFSVSRDGTQIAAAGPEGGIDAKQPLRLYRVDVAGGATTLIGEAPPSHSDILFPAPSWRADDAVIPVLNYTICYEFPAGGGDVQEKDFDACAEASTRTDAPGGRWAIIAGDGLVVGHDSDYAGAKKIDTVLGSSGKCRVHRGY